jgi:hypothetical protein
MLNNDLFQIDRVQNPRLYQLYKARKALLDRQNTGLDNEKTLWHGTSAENIASINKNGFDLSKYGKNERRSLYFC